MATAFIMISCDLGQEHNVANKLKSLTLITSVEETVGAYDIVARIETSSAYKIADTLHSKIEQMENIRSTLTLFTN